MRITYNAPFVLTFALICAGIQLADDMTTNSYQVGWLTRNFFTVGISMNFYDPLDYFRLFSHAVGHANWNHLISNFSLILLIGPMIEEKYGTQNLFSMSLITAVVTGILNVSFFYTGLMGASGIVFMLILLSSFTNIRSGNIPLTFILIVFLYLGNEIAGIFRNDNISQFAHIIGGICGGFFGFVFTNNDKK